MLDFYERYFGLLVFGIKRRLLFGLKGQDLAGQDGYTQNGRRFSCFACMTFPTIITSWKQALKVTVKKFADSYKIDIIIFSISIV